MIGKNMETTDQYSDLAPDEDLVEAAKQGSQRALEVLLRRYQGPLYRFLASMLWSPSSAEDATQEVLIKIITKLDNVKSETRFKAWAFSIARNHAVSMYRKRRTFRDYMAEIEASPDAELPGANGSVHPAAMVEEAKRACIRGALLCFTTDQRAVFVLGAVLEFTGEEGAEVLDITPASFRQRLKRARAELQRFLGGQCGLVNPANPCRCPKKTRAFISAGVISDTSLTFNPNHVEMADSTAGDYPLEDDKWLELFAGPVQAEMPDVFARIRSALPKRQIDHK